MAKFTRLRISDFLALCKEIMSRIEVVKQKVDTLSAIEVTKRNGSNYLLHFDGGLQQLRLKATQLENRSSDGYIFETDLFDDVINLRDKFYSEMNDFENVIGVDSTLEENKSSILHGCNHTSVLVNETVAFLLGLVDRAEYTLNVDEVIGKSKEILEINQSLVSNRSEFLAKYQSVLDESKLKIDSLNQITRKKEIEDIAQYYMDYKNESATSYSRTAWVFYILLGLVICLVGYIILDISWIQFLFKNEHLAVEISKNWFLFLAFTGFLGFLTFLLTDLRKRMNITKSILDEIIQKESVLKAYVVLLSKISDQSRENQKEMELKLFATIIENLVSIKNHGYAGKEMQSLSTNAFMEIINKLISKKD